MAGPSRPSTSCFLLNSRKEDVDARDKRGHDESHGAHLVQTARQPHTRAIADLMRSAPHGAAGVGAAPGYATLVPWPGRSSTRDPAAETTTLPRSTNTPNVPALGPAKKRVPRTEISANGLWIDRRDGVAWAGRSYRIGPDCSVISPPASTR